MKSAQKKIQKIVMDPFCIRQFDKLKAYSCINYDPYEFANVINEFYLHNKDTKLKPGYAPFCKHLFIENFTDSKPGYIKITAEKEAFIKTAYEARTEKELPVLKRFIPIANVTNLEKAKFLDIILYSKEQIGLENESMGNKDPNADIDYDYGIISIKPQDCDYELPMDPITIMRNALGTEFGGSGQKLENNKYKQSVEFWSEHVLIK